MLCYSHALIGVWTVAVIGALGLPAWGDNPDLLWGPDQGCFRGSFTRDKPLAEKARPIDPLNQDSDDEYLYDVYTKKTFAY